MKKQSPILTAYKENELEEVAKKKAKWLHSLVELKDVEDSLSSFIKSHNLTSTIHILKGVLERAQMVSGKMPHELKGIVDDYDDYQTGIMEAKLEMINALLLAIKELEHDKK